MEEEKKKYEASRERGRRRLIAVVKKKGTLSAEDMKLLYESYGVTPEDAREFLSEEGLLVPVPDIYQLLEEPRKKGRRDRKAVSTEAYRYFTQAHRREACLYCLCLLFSINHREYSRISSAWGLGPGSKRKWRRLYKYFDKMLSRRNSEDKR